MSQTGGIAGAGWRTAGAGGCGGTAEQGGRASAPCRPAISGDTSGRKAVSAITRHQTSRVRTQVALSSIRARCNKS